MDVPEPVSWPKTFKEACCDYFHCSPEAYELKVFWRALYRHALPVAFFLYRKNPEFFKEDFELIRELGSINKPSLFTAELNFFHGRNVRDRTWLRADCSIRISGKRLIRLKNQALLTFK